MGKIRLKNINIYINININFPYLYKIIKKKNQIIGRKWRWVNKRRVRL